MGMNTAQPSIMSQLNGDCCTAEGITCNLSSRVTRIEWISLSLNGTIDETLLPPLLIKLWGYQQPINRGHSANLAKYVASNPS